MRRKRLSLLYRPEQVGCLVRFVSWHLCPPAVLSPLRCFVRNTPPALACPGMEVPSDARLLRQILHRGLAQLLAGLPASTASPEERRWRRGAKRRQALLAAHSVSGRRQVPPSIPRGAAKTQSARRRAASEDRASAQGHSKQATPQRGPKRRKKKPEKWTQTKTVQVHSLGRDVDCLRAAQANPASAATSAEPRVQRAKPPGCSYRRCRGHGHRQLGQRPPSTSPLETKTRICKTKDTSPRGGKAAGRR